MLRSTFSLMCLLLVAGCTLSPKASFDIADVKRVAVVSILGDQANVYYLGKTIFGNQQARLDIADANLDQHYTSRIKESLANTGRFEVVDVEYDRAAWIAQDQDMSGVSIWRSLLLSPRPHEQLQPVVKALADEYSLDAVIVLVPEPQYTGMNTEPQGPAVYKGGLSGHVGWCRIGVFAGLVLANGEDGKVKGFRTMTDGSKNILSADLLKDVASVSLYHDDRKTCEFQANYASDEQLTQIKKILSSAITPQHIEVTLDKLMN